MAEAQHPEIHQPRPARPWRAWLHWLVPLLAIGLATTLVWHSLPNQGPVVLLDTQDGSGIQAGVTPIRFRGVVVGRVVGVSLSDDLGRVRIRAELQDSGEKLARSGSRFWVVRPELSLSGVRALDTLVSGPYIAVEPGDGPPHREFELIESRPSLAGQGSLKLVLRSSHSQGLGAGARIRYRGVDIGRVYAVRLVSDGTQVELLSEISSQHAYLVRDNSLFWIKAGLDVDFKLWDTRISMGSARDLISADIAMATPEPPGERVEKNQVFQLHDDPDEDWLEWAPVLLEQPEELGPEAPPEAPDSETSPEADADAGTPSK